MSNADEQTYRGYPHEQLRASFQIVKNKTHWKDPIDAVVPKDTDLDLIRAAVAFVTGSDVTTEEVPEGIRVRGDGYYGEQPYGYVATFKD